MDHPVWVKSSLQRGRSECAKSSVVCDRKNLFLEKVCMNWKNHRSSEYTLIWDKILASRKTPLRELEGGGDKSGVLRASLPSEGGVYVLRTNDENIVYIGVTGDFATEGSKLVGSSFDELLGIDKNATSTVAKRLAGQKINISECVVQIYSEEDPKKRLRIEGFGIAVFEPVGNN
jgi:hypothetical protein